MTPRRSRSTRRWDGPELVGDDVRRELSRFGPQAGMAELVRAWPAAVGEVTAYNAWPSRFQRDGTLIVHTADSVWAYELGQLEAMIGARLAGLVPGRIRFVPGSLPDVVPEESPGGEERREPSPEARAEAARLAEAIADEDLRNLVQKAAALSLSRAASDRRFW